MTYSKRPLAIAMLPLMLLSAGCQHTLAVSDVPPCERLIPSELLEPTPPTDQPVSAKLADGHDDAAPWQVAFIGQTGQLEIANAAKAAVDHIYRECLTMHREALKKSRRGFLGL